ncbi:hypothetical protein OQA88_8206 [Cercophora sp. LCS_1]
MCHKFAVHTQRCDVRRPAVRQVAAATLSDEFIPTLDVGDISPEPCPDTCPGPLSASRIYSWMKCPFGHRCCATISYNRNCAKVQRGETDCGNVVVKAHMFRPFLRGEGIKGKCEHWTMPLSEHMTIIASTPRDKLARRIHDLRMESCPYIVVVEAPNQEMALIVWHGWKAFPSTGPPHTLPFKEAWIVRDDIKGTKGSRADGINLEVVARVKRLCVRIRGLDGGPPDYTRMRLQETSTGGKLLVVDGQVCSTRVT